MLIIIVLTIVIFTGCKPNFDDCYDCTRANGGYYTSFGYVTTYETTIACSDDAARSLESKGWNCEGYYPSSGGGSGSGVGDLSDCYDCGKYLVGIGYDEKVVCGNKVQEYINDGYKCVNELRRFSLIAPAHKLTYASVKSILEWEAPTYPNGDPVEGILYDVYIDTKDSSMELVSKDQSGLIFSPSFAMGTKYYWKIVAKHNNNIRECGPLYFRTMPKIINGELIDNRDGKIYKTVNIGDEVWMAENLAYEIPGKEIIEDSVWKANTDYDGWSFYKNDKDSIGNIYGILYQWEAAKIACPSGWHLPSYAEWENTINDHLGGFYSGDKLKEAGTEHWEAPNEATNISKFTALPGGYRSSGGSFNKLGTVGSWWSADVTENYSDRAEGLHLENASNEVSTGSPFKRFANSVRCIKD